MDYETASDCELLEAINRDDLNAFHVLYNRYYIRLVEILETPNMRCKYPEDSALEAFLQLWLKRNTQSGCAPNRPPLPWLITVGKRKCIDRMRSENGEVPAVDLNTNNDDDEVAADILSKIDPCKYPPATPERLLLQEELHQAILACIANLPEDQRRRILLWAIEGLTNKEIAVVEDKTDGSISTSRKRALSSLRKCLAAKDFGPEDLVNQGHKP